MKKVYSSMAKDDEAIVGGANVVEQETESNDGGVGLLSQASGQGTPLPPEKIAQAEAANNIILKLVHSKETRDQIVELLSVGKPEQSIPKAANLIFTMVEKGPTNKIPSDIKLIAATSLVIELVAVGNAAGIFNIANEAIGPILKETYQQYVHEGLKNGTIDPISLQTSIAPLLSQQQKDDGLQSASNSGLPSEPTDVMAQRQITEKTVKPIQEENTKLKGLLANSGGAV